MLTASVLPATHGASWRRVPALAAVGALSLACSTRSEVGSFAPDVDAAADVGLPDSGGNIDASLNLVPSTARLSLGGSASCAITAQGGVQCWGDNTFGQLGVGDVNLHGSPQPLPVKGLSVGVRAVFGGPVSHCAVLNAGHATCWGDALFGVFTGRNQGGTHYATPSPVDAPGLTFVASMALGIYFHCALTTDGTAKCYGLNSSGQLGTGALGDNFTPAGVLGLEPSRDMAAAGFFTCAVTGGGAVKCWGFNDHGQLGNGSKEAALAPVDVTGLPPGATDVENGRDHACALVDGNVWCWGSNAEGQLGTPPGADRVVPAQVPGLPPSVEIACGTRHSCARSSAGEVHCWGATDSGASPTGPLQVIPADAVEVAAGGRHSCALLSSGVLRCWGSNDSGQLGPYAGPGAQL